MSAGPRWWSASSPCMETPARAVGPPMWPRPRPRWPPPWSRPWPRPWPAPGCRWPGAASAPTCWSSRPATARSPSCSTPPPPAGPELGRLDGELVDPDRLGRGVALGAAHRDLGDLVDHRLALDHLPEDRVVGLQALGVVLEVDEELAAA